MEVGYRQKMYNYMQATAAGIKVIPLIISTAGTMHKIMYKAIKKIFPEESQRRGLLSDFAIVLARGRAQIYCRELDIYGEDMDYTQT